MASGADTSGIGGGAIKITMASTDSCSLTLTNCIIRNCSSTANGGAIHCGGPGVTMNVTDCLFSNNTSSNTGGAIIFNGNATVTPITVNFTNTTFIGNSAAASSGGAIRNTSTSPINLTFKNCTLHGNSAATSGGAITVGNGSFSFVNCTVTGNSATTSYGGLYISNTCTVSLRNTIVAGNTGPTAPNVGSVAGTFVSTGGNLIGDNTGAPSPFNTAGNPTAGNDRVGTGASPIVPILSPPGNHGGTAWTRALLSGSPGINHGITAPSTGLTTDSRGATRIVGGTEDVGAYERSAAAADYTATSLPPGKAGDPYSYVLATGATGITYSVTNGSLPAPLALTNSSGTVTIAGTPAASGTSTFQITISNGTNDVVVQYQLVVGAGAGPTAPTVTTATQSAVTHNSATLGGNVTADGGASITARGVVYSQTSLNANPQLLGANVTNLAHGTNTTGVFTVNAAGLAAGTPYSFAAYATNSAGTTYTTPVSTFTTVAAVAVSSLNLVNATPTNAATVNWTLTFASAVTGVTATNFSLTGAAATGSNVGTPTIASGGGLTWNIPVTTGSTDGTLTLNLANETGLSSTLSTTLPFAGQSYTIDKTPPTVLSVTRQTPTGQTTNNTTVVFRVTYSEPVNLTAPAINRFAVMPVGGSTITGTVDSVSGTGDTRDVTVNLTGGTGEFRLRVLD
jgi:predicted outer membrane repeat protein